MLSIDREAQHRSEPQIRTLLARTRWCTCSSSGAVLLLDFVHRPAAATSVALRSARQPHLKSTLEGYRGVRRRERSTRELSSLWRRCCRIFTPSMIILRPSTHHAASRIIAQLTSAVIIRTSRMLQTSIAVVEDSESDCNGGGGAASCLARAHLVRFVDVWSRIHARE